MSTNVTPASAPELRHALTPLRGLEWRDAGETGDGSYTLTGHAAVFDQETVLYDLGWLRVREVVARGAFDAVLGRRPDVHLNVGHDMTRAIARTGVQGIGGLELSKDDVGLRVFARLDPEDPDVVSLTSKMRRGIVDQMSFAFTVARQERLSEEDDQGNSDVLRTIVEVGELYDVTVVAQGAYPQTDASLRSLQRMLEAFRSGRPLKRADVESISLLVQMYELGEQFIADETAADDGPDRDAMQSVLSQLEALIEAEASESSTESADGDETERGRPQAGASSRHRAAPAGAPTVAPAEPAGGGERAADPRVEVMRMHVRLAEAETYLT